MKGFVKWLIDNRMNCHIRPDTDGNGALIEISSRFTNKHVKTHVSAIDTDVQNQLAQLIGDIITAESLEADKIDSDAKEGV